MTDAFEMVYVRKEEEPILAPPRSDVGAIGWIRRNLLSSLGNIILTLLGVALIILVVPPLIRWAFIDAVWTGTGREACIAPGAGACWAFVDAKFGQFIYGRYPLDERWRVNLTAVLLVAGLAPMAIPRVPFKRENAIYLLAIFPLVALILLTGGNFNISAATIWLVVVLAGLATGLVALAAAGGSASAGFRAIAIGAGVLGVVILLAGLALGPAALILGGIPILPLGVAVCAVAAATSGAAILISTPSPGAWRRLVPLWLAAIVIIAVLFLLRTDFGLTWVETPLWGGLLVTLVVAIVGIVGSMPLGVLFALGRRSRLPVIRFVSIAFIEFVRGVPLITVLFMASVMLPLFLPPGVNFDKLLRALIGVTLFSAAYMAEVVRGGLQAIPRGQYEAASALGMGYWASMRLIILPQALKIVIPGIVNSFISLFKDTSLVLIIGIFDLLGIVQSNFTDANWASPNTPATGYAFAAVVYWAFCFGMSRYSIYTERRLDTGYRR